MDPTEGANANASHTSPPAPKARAELIPDLLEQVEAENAMIGLGKDEFTASVDASAMRGRIPHLDKHVDAIANEFKSQLEELRGQEIRRGVLVLGPHRDDLLFRLGDLELGAYGSRGQQRTAALALRLAESRLLRDRAGEQPILLLDDVLSELDESRRASVLDAIEADQMLITSPDPDRFPKKFVEHAQVLTIESGQASPA